MKKILVQKIHLCGVLLQLIFFARLFLLKLEISKISEQEKVDYRRANAP